MEVSNVICKTNYLNSQHLTLEIDVTALVNFNTEDGPQYMQTRFDYVPTEWPDDSLITPHSGEPQARLVEWLEALCPNIEDWSAVNEGDI